MEANSERDQTKENAWANAHWIVRAVLGLLSVVSVHIVSFFKEIEPIHFESVTVDLTSRVVWDLYSTAVYASYLTLIYSAVFWVGYIFIQVVIRTIVGKEIPAELKFPGTVRGGMIGIWSVLFSALYFGNPGTGVRVYYMVLGFGILAAATALFFVDWRKDSILFRTTKPFRALSVQLICAVAAILWISSATGAALARQYMTTGKVTVVIDGQSKEYSLLGMQSEGLFLITEDKRFIYLPNQAIDEVIFAPTLK